MIQKFFLYITQPILFIFSLVYRFLIFIRLILYKFSILKTKKLNKPVISIGNITVGGSGKTALVLEILKLWPELCVLTRGYKSEILKSKKIPAFVLDSEHVNLYGDEPSLIKDKNPKSIIVIDSDRYRGAKFALKQNPNLSGFLLDDGFQHIRLYRDFNILLLDIDMAINRPGLLPFGRFREGFKAITRADYVLLTKWNYHEHKQIDPIIRLLKRFNINFEFLNSNISEIKNHKNETLNSNKILLVSGLGQPLVFEKDLIKFYPNIDILNHIKYPDHYVYKKSDINEIIKMAQINNCPIVCSEKDYIKLKDLGIALEKIYFTSQSLDLSKSFLSRIKKTLERD